jgi:hypothetical protein
MMLKDHLNLTGTTPLLRRASLSISDAYSPHAPTLRRCA